MTGTIITMIAAYLFVSHDIIAVLLLNIINIVLTIYCSKL